MFQISILILIIVFCVGFLILFPEYADRAPWEVLLAAGFLIGQIVYLQTAFTGGRFTETATPFSIRTYVLLSAFLFLVLAMVTIMKAKRIRDRRYLVFSVSIWFAFLAASFLAFLLWNWSFGFPYS